LYGLSLVGLWFSAITRKIDAPLGKPQGTIDYLFIYFVLANPAASSGNPLA